MTPMSSLDHRTDPSSGSPGDAAGPVTATAGAGKDEVSRHIRGSSLLLVGKLLSIGTNLLVQVLIVRALSKSDYGAFAYALSIAMMVAQIITLGLDRGMARFVAIYDEEGDTPKLFGAVAMQVLSIVGLGIAAVGIIFAIRGDLADGDTELAALLAVMVFFAPVQALDDTVAGLFAVFAKPRAIFFRRHILAPGLRLLVVAILVLADQEVIFLAAGYVAAGAFGLLVYSSMLVRVFRQRGLRLGGDRISFPIREVTAYTLPLVTSDLLFVFMNSLDVILLKAYAGTTSVAAYRAVVPVARTNQIVMTSFALLFAPMVVRLFTRGNREGVRQLYWQTAAWMAVMTFPIFALTFGLSEPVTVGLFGEEYASSATYLAVLAAAYYFNAALGSNGTTLKMIGKVRYSAVIAVVAALVNLVLLFTLIPEFGTPGAVAASAITLAFYNVLKQAGLRLGSGIPLFERQYLGLYLTIVAAAIVLFVGQQVIELGLIGALALALAATAVVLWVGRAELRIGQTFPEIRRIPLVGRLLAAPPAPKDAP